MRLYILYALLKKEWQRHLANRGGLALALLLVAAAVLLSAFNPGGLPGGDGGGRIVEGRLMRPGARRPVGQAFSFPGFTTNESGQPIGAAYICGGGACADCWCSLRMYHAGTGTRANKQRPIGRME